MSDSDSRIPRRLTFIWKRCGNNCILVVTPGGERVLLDPAASKVWELIDDRRSVSSIKGLLEQGNGGPPGIDVEAVLNSMLDARVLTYESFLWAQE